MTEHELTCEVSNWLWSQGIYHHKIVQEIPNPDWGWITRLKKEGYRKGLPDLVVFLPNQPPLWIELKVKGGRVSPEQKFFLDKFARERGCVCYNLDQVKEFIQGWNQN